jgi:hypothetical protein
MPSAEGQVARPWGPRLPQATRPEHTGSVEHANAASQHPVGASCEMHGAQSELSDIK